MNYRDFYKKEQTLARPGQLSEKFDITKLSPKVRRGIEVELEHTPSKGKQLQDADARDIAKALKIAKDHFAACQAYGKHVAINALLVRNQTREQPLHTLDDQRRNNKQGESNGV